MVTVYTTFPSATDRTPWEFRERLTQEAKWAEAAGVRGMLVYSDNTLLDPWAAAQLLIENTERFVPLVAVNPVYMHPFSVARMISSIGFLHERRVDLNYVTGGFHRHLQELGCGLGHDRRYDRLAEYAEVVGQLLDGGRPVSYDGEFYQLKHASITPPLEPALKPGVFVSGTSDACRTTQQRLGATRLSYPREIGEYGDGQPLAGGGIRLGIIARDTAEEAWTVAHARFPSDPLGEEVHEIAAETVESQWHLSLSEDAFRSHSPKDTYWLYPFRAYKTFCPYLVGTYEQVGELLARYLALGVSTLILDEINEEADLHHSMRALRHAQGETA
ncbi:MULTISPECIES: LLM class flavin-dependent oxidoreductase [unclassified Streptomyces]|uniref:LLM class flavin-dependent oxidoreductase n=1 Tax=unclassified Streptomyces TaxID=2593676 RepID=UPI0033BD321B